MSVGEWDPRSSTKNHAKQYSVSIDVARREAAEASRRVLSTVRADQAAEAVAVLHGVMARSAYSKDAREVRNAIKAAELLTRYGGTEQKDLDLRSMLNGMSIPERRAWMERQLKMINTLLAELPSEDA